MSSAPNEVLEKLRHCLDPSKRQTPEYWMAAMQEALECIEENERAKKALFAASVEGLAPPNTMQRDAAVCQVLIDSQVMRKVPTLVHELFDLSNSAGMPDLAFARRARNAMHEAAEIMRGWRP